MMNKTIQVRRTLRRMQKPQLLMHFADHNEITGCHKCNETVNHYTYIPVLGNIYLCSKCKVRWNGPWGLTIFKEMINVE